MAIEVSAVKSVAIRALSQHSQPTIMPLVDEVWAINNAADHSCHCHIFQTTMTASKVAIRLVPATART